MAHTIHLSIRQLAEFLLRGGSIDSRFSGLDRGLEGARIHRVLQKQGGKAYKAEVPLTLAVEVGDFCYQLTGRADGVLAEQETTIVDEIKTTTLLLERIAEEDNPAHWAQGCCYAHILCAQRGLEACTVQLTYCNVDTMDVKRFTRRFSAVELEEFVLGLLGQYEIWAKMTVEWKQERDVSLQEMVFPFEGYRDGQRKMAVACYTTFKKAGRLLCCAPTGIGKTLSTLFPAMKALGEGFGERIFYLTAKTITRKAAEDALLQLQEEKPLSFRSITLTAKDKVCFLDERNCTPEACPYAEGYYDRINAALLAVLQSERALGRDVLERIARQYSLCPYELSLDLAVWCDCIIGDYNYLFDPVVHLQRFFEAKGGEYLFLVDEAHNLVDRSREMYSAQLQKEDFFAVKKLLPKQYSRLHKALGNINSAFVALRHRCEEAGEAVLAQKELPEELQKPVRGFVTATEEFLEKYKGSAWEQELLALYFGTLFYCRIAEEYTECYTTLIYKRGANVAVKLFCLDSSAQVDKSLALGRATVLFSATLQPLAYYKETFGCHDKANLLALGSPFQQENLGLFVADGVSTKYADREESLATVADLLAGMTRGKAGNYIAYFPSYSYMRQVLEIFEPAYPGIQTLVQSVGMQEQAREKFLSKFTEESSTTLLGFCVMGGIFSEGVDLPGRQLVGTAIVGVGLPQMGPEPDALRSYYDNLNGHGFEYAYQFPGMNKVLQAAGRVIRTETDRGVVLLIDQRFTTLRYRSLYPHFWSHWQRINLADMPHKLQKFWENSAQ